MNQKEEPEELVRAKPCASAAAYCYLGGGECFIMGRPDEAEHSGLKSTPP
jgi:hypothetical protein